MVESPISGNEYSTLLQELIGKIQASHRNASAALNQELVLLYWNIGEELLQRQEHAGWGTKIIEKLAQDIKKHFPDTKGFSPRNLRNMRDLAREFPRKDPIWQQLLPNCPWGHLLQIMGKIKEPDIRKWYLRSCVEHGWSRNTLAMKIDSKLHLRKGAADTNFKNSLPPPQSDLAIETLKDPYIFDFLMLEDDVREREIERALIDHMKDFLLELGQGFAFVGNQYRITIGEEDYRLDLLFYHLTLRCFVVVELKAGEFKPEFAGKLNFYLSAVDDKLRHKDDNPTIGLLLCRAKNKTVVEYALRGIEKPLGISEFKLTESLPENFKTALPSIEELEAELDCED